MQESKNSAHFYICQTTSGQVWGKVKFWPGEDFCDIFDRFGSWVGWGTRDGVVHYARAGKGPLAVVALSTALELS